MVPSAKVPAELATWSELVAYLEAQHHEVQTHVGERLRLTMHHDGQTTPVGAYALRAPSETPWLVLAVKLGPESELRPRLMLIGADALPFGSIALLHGFAIIRQSLPLEALRTDQLEITLLALVRLAATLRRGPDCRHEYLYR